MDEQQKFQEELTRWKAEYPDRIDEQMARFFFFAGAAYSVQLVAERHDEKAEPVAA